MNIKDGTGGTPEPGSARPAAPPTDN